MQTLLESAKAKANHWLSSNIDEATKEQVKKLLASPQTKNYSSTVFTRTLSLAQVVCAASWVLALTV